MTSRLRPPGFAKSPKKDLTSEDNGKGQAQTQATRPRSPSGLKSPSVGLKSPSPTYKGSKRPSSTTKGLKGPSPTNKGLTPSRGKGLKSPSPTNKGGTPSETKNGALKTPARKGTKASSKSKPSSTKDTKSGGGTKASKTTNEKPRGNLEKRKKKPASESKEAEAREGRRSSVFMNDMPLKKGTKMKGRISKRARSKSKLSRKASSANLDECTVQVKLSKDVRCLGVVDSTFWEASRDGTVHIRKLKDGTELGVIRAQDDRVRNRSENFFVNVINMQNNKVWMGDSTGSLRAYTLDGQHCLMTQKLGAQAGVRAFVSSETYMRGQIWHAGESWAVTQVDSETARIEKTMLGHKSWVNCLTMDNVHLRIWSGSEDGIRVWTTELIETDPRNREEKNTTATPDCLKRLKHSGSVLSLASVDHMVWSGGMDKHICVWRASNLSLVKKVKAGKSPVTCIKVCGMEVFSASSSSDEIQIWSRSEEATLLRKIKLGVRAKVVDIVHAGRTAWIGTRAPGYLLKYSATSAPAGSTDDHREIADPNIEQNAFTKFINWKFATCGRPEYEQLDVQDLFIDFSQALCPFLAVMSDGKLQLSEKELHANTQEELLKCAEKALAFMEQHGLDTPVELTAEAIVSDEPLPNEILEVVWEIIRKWHIRVGFSTERTEEALLRYVNSELSQVPGASVSNFGWSWHDGRALCAMVNTREPDAIDLDNVDPADSVPAIDIAIDIAHEQLGLPVLASATEITQSPNPRILMTYAACFKQHPSADPDHSTVEGPNWTVADGTKILHFDVTALYEDGQRATHSDCEAELLGDMGHVPVQVVNNRDGTFKIVHKGILPPDAFKLICRLDGEEIKNSPIDFVGNGAAPDKSFVEGPGLYPAGAASDNAEQRTFTVYARDKNDEPVIGSLCEIALDGPDGTIELTPDDNKDGSFTIKYSEPLGLGQYMLDVLLDGHPVRNSPVDIIVKPGASPEHSFADGPGLTAQGASSEDAEQRLIIVHALDDEEQPMMDVTCKVELHTPVGCTIVLDSCDQKDGTFKVEFDQLDPGAYSFEISLDGNPVNNSPVAFEILPGPEKGKCYADGPGLTAKGARNQDPVQRGIVIYARDSIGEPVIVCECQVLWTPPSGTQVVLATEDNGDGTFSVTPEAPLEEGEHCFEFLINEEHVSNSPYTLLITPGACHEESFVDGPGLTSEGAQSDDASQRELTVHSLSSGGEPVLDAECEILLNGSKDGLTIENNGDGTFTACYTEPLPLGEYMVDVMLDGEPVKNSPVDFLVQEPLTFEVETSGPGIEDGVRMHSSKTYFSMLFFDMQSGDPVAVDGVKVIGTGPTGTVLETTLEHLAEENQYTVRYSTNEPGKHSFVIIASGHKLDPVSVEVAKGACAFQSSDFEFSFTCFAVDNEGPRKCGGDKFDFRAEDENGERVEIDAKDNDNGSYSASFVRDDHSIVKMFASINRQPAAMNPITTTFSMDADDDDETF